jgi:hypothetical protein
MLDELYIVVDFCILPSIMPDQNASLTPAFAKNERPLLFFESG